MADAPPATPQTAAAQAWAGRYIVTSMLTGVVSTFGACHTFFVMVDLPAEWAIAGNAAGPMDVALGPVGDQFSVP